MLPVRLDDELAGGRARRNAAWALLLVVPAPSIGAAVSLIFVPGTVGAAVYAACKIWLYGLPLFWLLLVDRRPLSLSPVKKGGMGVGVLLGVLIAALILAIFAIRGIAPSEAEQVRRLAENAGFASLPRFLLLAGYLTTVNSLLEDYVFRWFIFRKWETLLGPNRGWTAVLLAAACFTLHHVIVLRAQFGWGLTLGAGLGVFVGGLAWSWCYLRYRSIWPGYVSHAIVDLAIFFIGWRLLFGSV
jgi:hypothetical protein